MSPLRVRAAVRPGLLAWSRARARMEHGRDDSGFTMVEVIVALVIIGIIMSALATFFVSTVKATAAQGAKQAAAQLADDGIEQVRALPGSAVVAGRDKSTSDTQWSAAKTGSTALPTVVPYLSSMTEAYDANAATGAGATAALPTSPTKTTVNNLDFYQNWFIGTCYQATGGGACTTTVAPASFYRVVVAVTWRDTTCPSSTCSFIETTLVSNAALDPSFNSNLVAQPPSVINPGNQTSDKGVAIATMTMTATGGAGALIWSGSGFPTGLSINSAGDITGTPGAVGTFTVTISATDQFGLVGSGVFNWTIVLPPAITAAAQSDYRGALADYTPVATGGSGTLTWTAAPLPPGITNFNSTTGEMSGTPTTIGTTTVVLTVTDGQGQTVSKSFVWTISAAPTLTVTTPAAQTSGANVALPSALQVTSSGGIASYAWSASNLPPGLAISSSGAISGTPTTPGVYPVTVTVTDSSSQSATTNAFNWTVWGITSPPTSLESDVSVALVPVTPRLAFAPSGAVTWTISGNPSWMTINSSTGVISGTASSTVTPYNVTVTASIGGKTAVLNITWVVTTRAIVTGPNANQFSAVGNAISTITATSANFTGTPTWSSSNLPPGITMTTGGVISGTPTTAGVYSVTITATTTGATDSQNFTWIVENLVITNPTTSARTNVHGTTLSPSITATATGGTGTLTWADPSATLPKNLVINSSTGVISGSFSTTTKTYNVTITVTDGYGISDPQSFNWTVT